MEKGKPAGGGVSGGDSLEGGRLVSLVFVCWNIRSTDRATTTTTTPSSLLAIQVSPQFSAVLDKGYFYPKLLCYSLTDKSSQQDGTSLGSDH